MQEPHLIPNDLGAELAIRPLLVAGDADLFGNIDHDRHGEGVIPARQLDQVLAILGADVGRVDDGQPAARQPLAGDEMQHPEGILGGVLIGLVVGDPAAAAVGGEHLRRREMPRHRLAEPVVPMARPARNRDLQLHVKTPLLRRGPRAGSQPMPSKRTATEALGDGARPGLELRARPLKR